MIHASFEKPQRGNALAVASIHFNDGPLTGNKLEGFSIHSKDGKLFATVPSRQWKDREGKTQFWDLLRYEGAGDGKWSFRNWLVDEYRKWSGPSAQADGDHGSEEVPF